MLPVPGMWHFEWHLQQMIWRYAGEWLLTPFALKCGRSHGQFKLACAKDFRQTDGVLEQFLWVSMCWIKRMIIGGKMDSVEELIEKVKDNVPLAEFLWVVRSLVGPYVYFRYLIRVGNVEEMERQIGYWHTFFVGVKKTKYARETAVFIRICDQLCPAWRKAYLEACVTYLPHGTVMTGTDALVEYVNSVCKENIPVGKRTPEFIRKEVPKINLRLPLLKDWEEFWGEEHERQKTMQGSSEVEVKDRDDMMKLIEGWFGEKWSDRLARTRL